VWGSTPQLGFNEHEACQRPQASQLHLRYARDLHDLFFVFKRLHFPINCSDNPSGVKPCDHGTLVYGCRMSRTVA
jgi:hypothetical protein